MPNNLNQFYTKPQTAEHCYQQLQKTLQQIGENPHTTHYIEPSAGEGSFLILLPTNNRTGIDIDPKHPDIIQHDYLTWTPPPPHNPQNTVTIGNPPFGHRSKLAIQFFNHAATMSHTIAYIVPNQFNKYSVHKQLHPQHQLIHNTPLPPNSFYTPTTPHYKINTTFQIWTQKTNHNLPNQRHHTPPPTTHPDFDMWQYNNTPQALKVFHQPFDFAVPRQGYHDYTRRETNPDNCERSTQWILFKAHNPTTLTQLWNLNYTELAQNNTITPGFGKADVIQKYQKTHPTENQQPTLHL